MLIPDIKLRQLAEIDRELSEAIYRHSIHCWKIDRFNNFTNLCIDITPPDRTNNYRQIANRLKDRKTIGSIHA
jgi:hypothetical protein